MYSACVFNYEAFKGKKTESKVHLYFRLVKAKNLLDYNIARNWRMGELAKQAAISECHFIRKFQQAFGSSPHRYQVNMKLDLSAQLLLSNNITVNEIAFIAGFSDIHSFSKSFKKKFGLCPTKYKEAK